MDYEEIANKVKRNLIWKYQVSFQNYNIDPDDIVQEALYKFIKDDNFNEELSQPQTYLFLIAKCVLLRRIYNEHSMYKDRKFEPVIFVPIDKIEVSTIETEKDMDKERKKIIEYLKTQNIKWFEYLIDHHLNEMSYKEIALKYNIKEQDVKNRIHLCKKLLKKYENRVMSLLF